MQRNDRSERSSRNFRGELPRRSRSSSDRDSSFFNERDREMNRYDQDDYESKSSDRSSHQAQSNYGHQDYGRSSQYGSNRDYGQSSQHGPRYSNGNRYGGEERSYSAQDYGPANRSWGEDVEGRSSHRLGYGSYSPEDSRRQDGARYENQSRYQSQNFRDRYSANDYGQDDYYPMGESPSFDRLNDRAYGSQGTSYQPSRGTQHTYANSFHEENSMLGSSYGDRHRSESYRGKGPKNYSRTDERVREDLCQRLMDADEIDAQDIDVTVSAGTVTMTGTVENKRVKYLAEDLAERVSGVQEVVNNLRVSRQTESGMSAGSSTSTRSKSGDSTPSSKSSGSKSLN